MKRTLGLIALFVAATLGGCMKTNLSSTIKADGSGEHEFSFGYKIDTMNMLKEQAKQAPEGEEGASKLDEMEKAFDEKHIKEEAAKMGLEDVTFKSEEKDGWKNMSLKGRFKDISKLATGTPKDKKSDGPMGAMIGGHGFHFYKTADANIVKFAMVAPFGKMFDSEDSPLKQLEEMDEDQRAMVEAQMDQMRQMFALDQFNMELRYKLPGEITEMSSSIKKDSKDASTLIYTIKGNDIGLEFAKKMSNEAKDGMWVKFKKPADFKIALEEEPKAAESKPAAGTTPKSTKPAGEDEKKKKEDG